MEGGNEINGADKYRRRCQIFSHIPEVWEPSQDYGGNMSHKYLEVHGTNQGKYCKTYKIV